MQNPESMAQWQYGPAWDATATLPRAYGASDLHIFPHASNGIAKAADKSDDTRSDFLETRSMSAILRNAVHVWFTPLHDGCSESVSSFETLLTADELDRAGRFVFPKDRTLYVAARVHLRRVLSEYADIAPGEWRFYRDKWGRPFTANPLQQPLFFSLAHTCGLVASVVSTSQECGIDAEHLDRCSDWMEIASRTFAPAEYDALSLLEGESQRLRFFELWTLKEAYSKARGIGLSIGFERFTFDLTRHPIDVHFDPSLEDDAPSWRFTLLRPTHSHQVGVALRTGMRTDVNLSLRRMNF